MENRSLPEDLIRAHVFIAGIVQGVGFRYYTRGKAYQLGLNGWVKNLPDSRVEAVFEGEKTAVNKMVEWCYQGPRSAIVKNVNIEYEEVEGLQGFEITG